MAIKPDPKMWSNDLKKQYEHDRLMMELEHKIAMQQAAERSRVAGLMEMLSMRLFGGRPDPLPFPFAKAHKAGDQVFVFIVKGEEGMMLKDDAKMFPSDGLVTQIRLLLEDMPKAVQHEEDASAMAQALYYDKAVMRPKYEDKVFAGSWTGRGF